MNQSLSCTVQRIEEQIVHLRTTNGQIFSVPLSCIHGTPVPEGTVRLIGVVPEGGRVDDSLFAKTILNELLSPKS